MSFKWEQGRKRDSEYKVDWQGKSAPVSKEILERREIERQKQIERESTKNGWD